MSRKVRRRRCQGGQAIIETVMAVLLLCLIFFSLVQVGYLYMNQMIAHHTAFVTTRSFVVGFDHEVVQRASEVGSIGMSGHIVQPYAYTDMTPAQLGAIEEELIEEFLSESGYPIYYQHWGRISESIPLIAAEGMVTTRIRVNDYPLEMPMWRAYNGSGDVDFGSEMSLYNHAGYYLR